MKKNGKRKREETQIDIVDLSTEELNNVCRVPILAKLSYEEKKQIMREFEYGEVSLELICDMIAQKFGVELERLEAVAEEKGEQKQ